MAFLGNVFIESVKVTVSSPKRGNLDTGAHHEEDAKIGVVHPQALESRKRPANKQKPGEEHGANFFSSPKKNNPASTLTLNLQSPEL